MIKFRYKRKEPTAGSGTTIISSQANGSTLNSKNVENKSKELKNDSKLHSLKREATLKPQIDAKVKPISNEEYLAGCIKAVVVSICIYSKEKEKEKKNRKMV